ncbi:MAG: HAD family hydrolase [Halanaerobiaceae bacterium]|nr:HAD family hydrolase [Halanaerobiaceae bacterium]
MVCKKTILLDLDGTLLPMEIEVFLKAYFKLLTEEFAGIFEAEKLIKNLIIATDKMIENNGEKTNKEVFVENFFALMGVNNEKEKIMKRFDRFYLEKFPLLRDSAGFSDLPARLVKKLKEKGYQLVLATNPLFPEEALVERVRWVDIDPEAFSLITHYENMHYCKPNINYYWEIVDKLRLEPGNCIMIGNDVQEDLIAGKLGMKTYLVTDFLIDRENKEIKAYWQGSFEDLMECF